MDWIDEAMERVDTVSKSSAAAAVRGQVSDMAFMLKKGIEEVRALRKERDELKARFGHQNRTIENFREQIERLEKELEHEKRSSNEWYMMCLQGSSPKELRDMFVKEIRNACDIILEARKCQGE